MSKRTLVIAAGIILCWVGASVPCSLTKRPIWAKNPKSTSPLFRVVIDDKVGYIDQAGRAVISPQFNPYYVEPGDGDFVEGFALVLVGTSPRFIDETGKIQDFSDLRLSSPFSDSITAATRLSDGTFSRQVALVNHAGHVLAVVDASMVGPFSEDLAAFAQNNPSLNLRPGDRIPDLPFGHARGYLDRRGRVVIKPTFAYAGPFSEGLAAVAMDGSCWVAGWGGSRFPAPSAKVLLTSCGPQVADSVVQSCRHGYIDKTGRLAIPASYELAQEFAGGLAGVRAGGKWGFIDRRGNGITGFRFDEVRAFSEDRAAVQVGGKWGYIDASGTEIITLRFGDALPFSDGLAAVKIGDHYVYVDRSGAERISGPFIQATQFVQGLAHVQIGRTQWAWISRSGQPVFSYDWEQKF